MCVSINAHVCKGEFRRKSCAYIARFGWSIAGDKVNFAGDRQVLCKNFSANREVSRVHAVPIKL